MLGAIFIAIKFSVQVFYIQKSHIQNITKIYLVGVYCFMWKDRQT
jgi:hypothetical protein